ncbi:hypothetical protein BH11PSE10_BH11PSE10_21380 [soil metagenome]
MANAKPRPRLDSISWEELNRLDDDDREVAVIEWVGRHLESTGDELKSLELLPRGLQIFYLSFVVEAEVMNGGFNQFFWNSSSRYAPLIEPALGELGAAQASLIFREAWAVAISENAGRPESEELSLETFSASYQNNRLNDFDAEFCALAMQFPVLRRHVVDANEPTFFVMSREG